MKKWVSNARPQWALKGTNYCPNYLFLPCECFTSLKFGFMLQTLLGWQPMMFEDDDVVKQTFNWVKSTKFFSVVGWWDMLHHPGHD